VAVLRPAGAREAAPARARGRPAGGGGGAAARARALSPLAWVLSSLAGCQLVGGFDDVPSPRAGAPAPPGAELPSQWACLDEGPPPATADEGAEFRFGVAKGVDQMPASGVRVRVCGALDVTCSNPITDYVPVVGGVVAVPLGDRFYGYLEIVADDFVDASAGAIGAYVPALVFFSRREIARRAADRRVPVFTADELGLLTGFIGTGYALDRPPNALLVATALDCRGVPAPGVGFRVIDEGAAVTPETVSFFTDANLLPSRALRETSELGIFGQTSLRPGAVTLAGVINPLGRPLNEGTSAFVRTNWMTTVYVSP
jgi:hypothetical protein